MATSDVAVVNLALTKLGENRITDLDDNTKPAREANAIYTMLRDKLLRRFVWRFAVKRVELAALVSTPAHGYDYEYQMPTDCLRILQVGDYYPSVDLSDFVSGPTAPYQIEGGKILHNDSGPLNLRYITRVEDPTLFDACFDEMFASLLAYNLAEPLTQSNTKKEAAWQDYKQARTDAVIANAIENPPETLQDDTWVAARI